MKTFKMIQNILPLMLLVMIFSSCKDDDYDVPVIDVIYSMEVEGNQVAFKNATQGASTYRWDFGDGSSSTDADPVHIYPGKGKYVATLYATTASGQTEEGSTVIRIAKTTPVKLNDNTLDDWDAVTANVFTTTDAGNAIKKVKLDYDGNGVYIYVEMLGKRSDGQIFDFYLDSDNSSATGLLTGSYTEGGYDILMEGQLLMDWFDIFYHTGAQTAFSFAIQSISEAYTLGTVVEDGGMLKFECRLERGKLKGLTGNGLRIAIAATKSDWSATLGSAPAVGSASYFLDMEDED
ncbi:PKD domain-containing protein [Desertivirga xinjiangensis]|uniref:PKD domain-containing protein n=1 Tax=Desertivirga xinjiangensis TaxID=539206 RepID=UPI002108B470|nr:PKD domain-containing protein [Pedobacter xinjiangensis]